MDEGIDVLWDNVLEGWDDDKRHQAFLLYCAASEQLAEAARRYREIAQSVESDSEGAPPSSKDTPYRSPSSERREQAKKRLQAISLLAVGALDGHRTDYSYRGVKLGLKIFAVLFFIAAAFSLVWAFALSP